MEPPEKLYLNFGHWFWIQHCCQYKGCVIHSAANFRVFHIVDRVDISDEIVLFLEGRHWSGKSRQNPTLQSRFSRCTRTQLRWNFTRDWHTGKRVYCNRLSTSIVLFIYSTDYSLDSLRWVEEWKTTIKDYTFRFIY